uniref:Cytochrome c oxidase subunit 1 n=1 Tax=Heterorhabditis bacteriophora TaxID=37862 RepID=A0A1I7WEE7_HETBA
MGMVTYSTIGAQNGELDSLMMLSFNIWSICFPISIFFSGGTRYIFADGIFHLLSADLFLSLYRSSAVPVDGILEVVVPIILLGRHTFVACSPHISADLPVLDSHRQYMCFGIT